jgi:hypothetical protein
MLKSNSNKGTADFASKNDDDDSEEKNSSDGIIYTVATTDSE